MTQAPAYKRILLKLSGEALMGEERFGISTKVLSFVAEVIAAAGKTLGIPLTVTRFARLKVGEAPQ